MRILERYKMKTSVTNEVILHDERKSEQVDVTTHQFRQILFVEIWLAGSYAKSFFAAHFPFLNDIVKCSG